MDILSGTNGGVILAGGGDVFVGIVVMIIFGIVSLIKSVKEKKEREERKRNASSAPKGPSLHTKPKPKSTSIEDFLKELSGETGQTQRDQPRHQAEPEREEIPQATEWHAPQAQQEDYYQKRKRELAEQKKKRDRDRNRKEQEKALEKQRRLKKQYKKLQRKKKREQPRAEESVHDMKPAVEYDWDAHSISDSEGDLYTESAGIKFSRMSSEELRKAVVMREILGPPVSLKEEQDPFGIAV